MIQTQTLSAVEEYQFTLEGKELYLSVCANCHGKNAEGKKIFKAPALSILSYWYIKKQLKNFKSGERGKKGSDGERMKQFIDLMPDEKSIQKMATYLNALPAKGEHRIELKGHIQSGKKLYTNHCSSCHGVDAKGNKKFEAPNLQKQHDWYLFKQLKYMQSGLRKNTIKNKNGKTMIDDLKKLTHKNFKDIIVYIKSLEKQS